MRHLGVSHYFAELDEMHMTLTLDDVPLGDIGPSTLGIPRHAKVPGRTALLARR